jgi:hypothetical protein
MNTFSFIRRTRSPSLLRKAAPGLCLFRVKRKGQTFRNAFRNAFRISQIVFFGAHTPQEYHR